MSLEVKNTRQLGYAPARMLTKFRFPNHGNFLIGIFNLFFGAAVVVRKSSDDDLALQDF